VTPTTASGAIYRYSINYDSWEQIGSLNVARRLSTCSFDSSTREILILYGLIFDFTGNPVSTPVMEKFRVDTNVTSTVTWPGIQADHGAAPTAAYDPVTNNTYIIGGSANGTRLSILSQTTGWSEGTPLNYSASYGSVAFFNNELYNFANSHLQIYNIGNKSWRSLIFGLILDDSASMVAPISGPNIHVFAKANKIAPCMVPCPAPSSPCLANECDINTGTCSIKPVYNGMSCGNADGCTDSNCVCTNGQCLPDILK